MKGTRLRAPKVEMKIWRRGWGPDGLQVMPWETYPRTRLLANGEEMPEAALLQHTQHYDVRRAFQIWEEMTAQHLMRGLAAKASRQHYAGVIGALNGKALTPVQKHGKRYWRLTDANGLLYSGWSDPFRLLPPEGVQAARTYARRLAANRKQVTP